MTKYKRQWDDINVVCPYCGHTFQPEGEDYTDYEVIEECEECGKSFHHFDDITVTHYTRPDCELNGVEHQWKEHVSILGDSMKTCETCGKVEMVK